jgi:hypothetical protein
MNETSRKIAEQAFSFAYEECKKVGRTGGDGDHIWVALAMGKQHELIVKECIYLCEQHGNSALYSYTPSKAKLVEKGAYGCGQLIARKFGVEK